MKKRRLLSIVLSLCMVLALMPQMVFATDISGEHNEDVTVNNGDTISGGTFNGKVRNFGTINDGTFYGWISNLDGQINGGTFKGTVDNVDAGSKIYDGTFKGTVNNGQGSIYGGTFYETVNAIGGDGSIYGGIFYGGISGNDYIGSSCSSLTFMNGDITYAIEMAENGKKATEPETPTKEGYKFTGWYADEELTELYDFDSTVVTENIYLYAGFELPTLTVPFTTTVVKEEGSLEPPKDTTFNLEVVDSYGNELSCDNVTITAESVTTDGAGSYYGKIAFTGKDYEILRMFTDKEFVFVKQAEGDYPNWKVDDTVWCLSHNSVAELSEDEAEPSLIVISKATIEESENGIFYNINEDEGTFDNVSFTNKYNKQEENPAASEGTTGGNSDNADKNAKTGDDTNLALWLALMLLSCAGITGVTAYTRRKRTNE